MSSHHSDQMSQRSQVSRVALWMTISKVLSQWLSQWQGHLLSCSGQLKIQKQWGLRTKDWRLRTKDWGFRIEEWGPKKKDWRSRILSPQSLYPLKPKKSSKIENILTSHFPQLVEACQEEMFIHAMKTIDELLKRKIKIIFLKISTLMWTVLWSKSNISHTLIAVPASCTCITLSLTAYMCALTPKYNIKANTLLNVTW